MGSFDVGIQLQLQPQATTADTPLDPAAIERTDSISASEAGDFDAYLEPAAQHLIVMSSEPFAFDAIQELVAAARSD